MEKFSVERLVYDGSDPSDCWIVNSIGHSRLNMDNVEIMDVATLDEYESGCSMHENCLGHICRTPHGMLLPIQSLAISTPTIRNDIYKAAEMAFKGSTSYYVSEYKKILADSMKKKTGRLRKGIMNCYVDGSLRMVVTPQDHADTNIVCIPYYLQDKWSVVRLDKLTNKYKSDYVKSGDRAILIRPPSLTQRSVQPVIIEYWNETCMGVSAELLKALEGDFDGDECHVYPVYSDEAVEECKQWKNTPNVQFEKAREIFQDTRILEKENQLMSFMEHTTMSFDQIREGDYIPLMAEQTRTRREHIVDMRHRYDIGVVGNSFLDESIRGMSDVNDQQHMQPIVGDVSRIARIAASCVLHKENDTIGIATESDFVPMYEIPRDIAAGSSAVRAISNICASLQQAALSKHHATKRLLPSHDLISDMIVGSSDDTLILFSVSTSIERVRSLVSLKWAAKNDDAIHTLCKLRNLSRVPKDKIIGAYNPLVLRLIAPDKRIEVCKLGIRALADHYGISLSEVEVISLSVLYSFKPEKDSKPITTKDGMLSRRLRWTEVTMGNHYTSLVNRLKKGNIDPCPIETASACLMAGNFRDLN